MKASTLIITGVAAVAAFIGYKIVTASKAAAQADTPANTNTQSQTKPTCPSGFVSRYVDGKWTPCQKIQTVAINTTQVASTRLDGISL